MEFEESSLKMDFRLNKFGLENYFSRQKGAYGRKVTEALVSVP